MNDHADAKTHFADEATIAELESLRQQLAEQKQLFDDYREFMSSAAIDAKRYRYFVEHFGDMPDENPILHKLMDTVKAPTKEQLDAAIDAAMKEAP